jgi:uncharacterized membrane protein YbhN (UPF0104 family)
MKLHRNSKTFINYFLGPLLFLWLSWSIYNQVRRQQQLSDAWHNIRDELTGPAAWNFALIILLMIVNWAIEALKWKISVKEIQEVSFGKSFRAVLSGVSFAVSTPNRIGEYLGRMLYMNEGNRLRTISITIVGSMSQLIITCVMGILALMLLRSEIVEAALIPTPWYNVILSGAALVLAGLLLFYFRLSWITRWVEKIPGIKKYVYLVSAIDHLSPRLLFQLLLLSLVRFLVFIAQYALVFPIFAVSLDLYQVFWGVSLSFLVMAAVPTIALIELPLRGKTMATILGIFSANTLGIGLAAAMMWLINLVIPAIIGSLLILGLRKLVKNEPA